MDRLTPAVIEALRQEAAANARVMGAWLDAHAVGVYLNRSLYIPPEGAEEGVYDKPALYIPPEGVPR